MQRVLSLRPQKKCCSGKTWPTSMQTIIVCFSGAQGRVNDDFTPQPPLTRSLTSPDPVTDLTPSPISGGRERDRPGACLVCVWSTPPSTLPPPVTPAARQRNVTSSGGVRSSEVNGGYRDHLGKSGRGAGHLRSITEGWLEIDKHYSLELCFSVENSGHSGYYWESKWVSGYAHLQRFLILGGI